MAAVKPVRVCFVCLGNICRSPLADAVLRHRAAARGLSERVHVESRGVGDWHLGEPADARMRQTAQQHGVDVDGVSELWTREDYAAFDLVLSMDAERQAQLEEDAPANAKKRIRAFRTYDPDGGADDDVPDPYYGGADGFETVFEIVDRTCEALLDRILDGTYLE